MKASQALRCLCLVPACAISIATLVPCHAASAQARAPLADSGAVVRVAAQFQAALARGDSASAVALLSQDVRILESGELQNRAEYISHHLPADIAFARAVPTTLVVEQVKLVGDAAWITRKSSTSGTFEGRAVRSEGVELMVLRRESGAWRIAAVHWSSRRPRSNP